MTKISIAIDGHSSTGKSTVAKRLAEALGYIYIDTGAMYRAVTLFALEEGLAGEGRDQYRELLDKLEGVRLEFRKDPENSELHIFLNGEDVDRKIRDLKVSEYVSQISELGPIREKLVAMQQHIAKDRGVVMDGRDIGTVVLPEAELKIFMTANAEKRAIRRFEELRARGAEVSLEEVRQNIESRDFIDANREIAPLKQAPDAVLIDNSDMSHEEQFQRVLGLAQEAIKAQKKGC